MGGGREVGRHDGRDLGVRMADARHHVQRSQVVDVGAGDAAVGREPDDEIEGQQNGRHDQELVAEGHRLRQQRERHERHRQEREEHPSPREGLVIGQRPG